MAQIRRFLFASHIRSEASSQLQHFRKGGMVRSGRGLAFWFDPSVASISEVPMADRELTFMVKTQTADYQDLAVQGTILWRVADAARVSERVDFTIDMATGLHLAKPEDQIRSVLTGLAREFSDTYVKRLDVRAALEAGLAPLQAALNDSFQADATATDLGLTVFAVRIAALTPSSELARALQTPTFESLQQKADEATFARRALAVDKERAIAENELANRVELAARRRELITREDENARSEAEGQAAAQRIGAEAAAEAAVIAANAEATRIRAVELAAVEMEKMRMEVMGQVPPATLFALAAREFAGKLERIDNMTISPDMLAGLMGQVRALAAPAKG
jgi:regulator of protease activity HflC (stomatin/prohibitin superfamily)